MVTFFFSTSVHVATFTLETHCTVVHNNLPEVTEALHLHAQQTPHALSCRSLQYGYSPIQPTVQNRHDVTSCLHQWRTDLKVITFQALKSSFMHVIMTPLLL